MCISLWHILNVLFDCLMKAAVCDHLLLFSALKVMTDDKEAVRVHPSAVKVQTLHSKTCAGIQKPE